MSRHVDNLGRAARLLRRLDGIGGVSEFEGAELREIAGDVLLAQSNARMHEIAEGFSVRVDPPCARVIPLRERRSV